MVWVFTIFTAARSGCSVRILPSTSSMTVVGRAASSESAMVMKAWRGLGDFMASMKRS
jgi:hypothetical protein